MNQLTYHVAMTRHQELLRQAAAHRSRVLTTTPTRILPAILCRPSSRRAVRELAATLRVGDLTTAPRALSPDR